MIYLGHTHTRQSVLCLSMFDPHSPVFLGQCERSVPCPNSARFVGPGTVGKGELRHGTDAHAQTQAQSAAIAVRVCGGFTLNSGRLHRSGSSSVLRPCFRGEQCVSRPAGERGVGEIVLRHDTGQLGQCECSLIVL